MALAFIASSAASTIIENLVNAGLSYVDKHQVPRGMQEELQRLQQALPQIKAILAAVEVEQQMTERNEALEAWMWQFRDAVEEAEDVLDEVEYYEIEKRVQAPDDQVRGTISKLKRKFSSFVSPSFRNDTLKRLSEAVKGLDRVAAGMGPCLQLVGGLSGYGVKCRQFDEIRNSRETSSFLLEKEVLGRKTESDMIIEWLIKPTSDEPESLATANISVFSIVGIGGMGKTTLAQLIYGNGRVQQYFDQTMWVCVSDIFDAAVLTSKILQDMTKRSPNVQNLNTLQNMLSEKLISKRFLLVLDDVWNDNNRMEWEKLVAPLKFGRRGSKILLTTRMDSVADMVARVMECKKECLKLEGLKESDCMLLFNRHAFANVDPNDHKNLQSIGKQIAEKLRGCPLVAKVMGGLLNSCMDYNYWKRMLSDNIVNLQQGVNGTMEVLKLSYHHLPTDLQLCFRHCSLFPQDHRFRGNELIYMWMGLGFVRQCGKQSPEDIGKEYLAQLTRKSFFDILYEDVYVMHDLLHDLAQSVSSKECLRRKGDSLRDISKTIRHVSIETTSSLLIREISCLKNLRTRTLILHIKKDRNRDIDHALILGHVLKELKSLRLLCITADYLCKLPDALDTLIHLRYLSFQPESDFNKNLPEWFSQSVCRLYHLQVLDIRFPPEMIWNIDKNSITEINGLSDLVNLRLLNVPHGLMTKIRWIGKLTSLQKLRNFHIRVESGYKIGELKDLAELSEIDVGNLENVRSSEEAVESKLNEKENLSSLSLNWSGGRSSAPEVDEQLLDNLRPHINLQTLSIEGYIGVRYPCWMTDFCLPNLTSIHLRCSRLEQFPPLGQLALLRNLCLSNMAAIKRVDWSVYGSADGCAFPFLEEMKCFIMPAWEEWLTAADGCPFPQLKILKITDCPNLRGMPTLPLSLRELTIHNVGITAIPAMYRDISNDNNSASSFELAPSLCVENSPSQSSIDGFLLQQQEYFQALRILSIEECERLVHLPPEWSANLFSLESLTIIKCPKLITCGIQDSNLPSAIQSLSFGSCGGLYASLLGRLPYLTSLTSLTLRKCAITTSLPGAEVFARLASLSRLWIWYCRELASFGGIEALASLKYLSVVGCDKLITVSLLQPPLGADVSQGGAVASSLRLDHLHIDRQSLLSMEPLRNLSSTRILTLDGSSQLTSLPEQWLLQNRSSLQCLIIGNADSLQSLPPSMTSLYSLQKLTLFGAPSIQSLPEFPASLWSLKIGGCHPVLEERCQKDTGLEWPKIANIPHVTITNENEMWDTYG
ncbi:putative disease resistance protein RGA1 [Ananas comosus]|uniref:Disease resistance protein RGA1 n=2 Tax=Ananas comosus TaxID=4615 RepID=A0A6P5FB66_ANACO|nr:putative disease resistance protein RGA1 [Ananas comosus]